MFFSGFKCVYRQDYRERCARMVFARTMLHCICNKLTYLIPQVIQMHIISVVSPVRLKTVSLLFEH